MYDIIIKIFECVMSIFEQASLLFVNMDFVTLAFLVVGLLCIIGEIYQPGTIALGFAGGICLIAGILMRVLSAKEGENLFCIVFLLVAILAIVILISFVIMIRFARYDWVNHMPNVQAEVEEDEKYKNLRGKEGVTLTTLRPGGRAEICSAEYEVYAEGFFINLGEKVKVTRTEGGHIYVKKI